MYLRAVCLRLEGSLVSHMIHLLVFDKYSYTVSYDQCWKQEKNLKTNTKTEIDIDWSETGRVIRPTFQTSLINYH